MSALDWLESMKGLILDGWSNPLTGLGDAAKDKTSAATPLVATLSYNDALAVYRASDTAKTVVNLPVISAFKNGFDVRIPGDEDASEAIGAELDQLRALDALKLAARKARLFGGSIIYVNAFDKLLPEQPLAEDRLDRIVALQTFDPNEISCLAWEGDLNSVSYGQPVRWNITPALPVPVGQLPLREVHASRTLYFCTDQISRILYHNNRGFGDSILDAIWLKIRDYDQSYQHSAALVSDFAQAVIRIKGLAAAMAQDQQGLIKKRMALLDMGRSVLRAMVLDAEEDFERKPTPISGLPELLDRFANRVAAATRIPVSILMGQAPAGLNATGAADLEAYREMVTGLQADYTPAAEQLVRLLMRAKSGPTKGKEPDNWSIVWRPLSQPTESDLAESRLKTATADQIYFTIGALSADEIRSSRWGGDAYSLDTQLEGNDLESEDAGAGEGEDMDPEDQVPTRLPAPGAGVEAGATKAADTALNGAQVTAAVDIVAKVHAGQLPRASGVAMLAEFFNLDPAKAERIVGPAGFVPDKPDPLPAQKNPEPPADKKPEQPPTQ